MRSAVLLEADAPDILNLGESRGANAGDYGALVRWRDDLGDDAEMLQRLRRHAQRQHGRAIGHVYRRVVGEANRARAIRGKRVDARAVDIPLHMLDKGRVDLAAHL